jgi:patatin-related protein
VVLNGGVSLAVWMGGVCAEVHDLTHGAGVYGRLLRLIQASARVDVIAGTSAGGINGAFLALGQTYETADLGSMLKLWADRGSFEELLRSPIRGNHDSLLRGDDYFLPELEKAFRAVIGPDPRPTSRHERPIDLFLTCTNLAGEPRPFTDSLGQSLWEVEHTGLFHFSRSPREAGMARDGDDLLDADVARRLALAARSTASFPGAFEPAFVPVQEGGASPDMDGIATFSQSRFVIDGGVLRNEPVAPALAAIWRLPAEAQVRRVLLYVNPDPAPPGAAEPDRPDAPPPLRDVLLASLTRLTIQQSVHEELEAIEASNRRARRLKDAKPNLIAALPARLDERQLQAAFERYRSRRADETARRLARVIRDQWLKDRRAVREGRPEQPLGVSSPSETWRALMKRAREAPAANLRHRRPPPEDVQGAQTIEAVLARLLGQARKDELPWVPKELAGPEEGRDWSWGLSPIERLLAFALDQLVRAQSIANRRVPGERLERGARTAEQEKQVAAHRRARKALWTARASAHGQLRILRAIRRAEDAYWRIWAREARAGLDELAAGGCAAPEAGDLRPRHEALLAVGVARVIQETENMVLAEGEDPTWTRAHLKKTRIATVALQLLRLAARAVATLPPADAGPADEESRYLRDTLQGLAGERDLRRAFRDTASIVKRLLLAEVYVSLAGLDRPADEQQEVALALISGHARPLWAPDVTAEEKIAGLKLGHFGAFYKRSWRVNDWFWGRVDGATRLCDVLLEPGRLWQLGCTRGDLEEALEAAGVGEALQDRELSEELACYEAQRIDPPSRTLTRLERTAAWFARARHREVVGKDAIDTLAEACHADMRLSTSRRARGAVWAAARRQVPAAPGDYWLEQLRDAGVGAETFEGELGTDQLSRTVATLAADATATLKSARAGLGPLRAPLQAIHGVALLLYALITSWTGGRVGAALTNFALAVGGALVALGAIAPAAVPRWITGAGAAVLLAGFTAAALRSRLRSLATVTGPPVLFLALLMAFSHQWETPASWTPVLLVLGLVAAAWLLGFASEPEGLPGLRHLLPVLKGVGAVAVVALAGWAAPRLHPLVTSRLERLRDHPVEVCRYLEASGRLLLVTIGLSVLVWPALHAIVRSCSGEPDAPAHREARHAMGWLPWYGAPFALLAIWLTYHQMGHWEGPVAPAMAALLLTSAASWFVLTVGWPLAVLVRPGARCAARACRRLLRALTGR